MKLLRGYQALRTRRVSIPEASYFVTLCTRDRAKGLDSSAPAAAITSELFRMKADGAFDLRAWVIMPDHVHLFFRLNKLLSLGQIVGRLKAKTRAALSLGRLGWQGNYYEHRLRPDDAVEEVLRYLYLNPYSANLLRTSERYPYFWLCAADAEWFVPTLDNNRPFPEWLLSS